MTDQPAATEPGAGLPVPALTGEAAGADADHGAKRPLLGGITGHDIIAAITEGRSAVVIFLAFVVAMVVGGVLIVFSDPVVLHAWSQFFSAPLTALSATWTSVSTAYVALFEGAIFSPATVSAAFHGGSVPAIFYPLSLTIFEATPLILTGLSVAVAFRAGLFNIGANGQFIAGAIVATWLGFAVHLPIVIHVIVCVIGAMIGGAVLGWLVGLLKAKTGAHEVIVTIMLNYIMVYLLAYLLNTPAALQLPGQSNAISPALDTNALFPHVGGPPPQAGLGFVIAIAAAAGLSWLLGRSTIGFQFRTVGANPSAARSAGMSVQRVWIMAMLLGGALAGLAASAIMLGQAQPLTNTTFGTYGFDGITVALLGRSKPWGVVLAGLLWGALDAGGTNMAAAAQVPSDIVSVIQGLIVLFVAAPPLIRAVFRLRATSGGGMESVVKGWNG